MYAGAHAANGSGAVKGPPAAVPPPKDIHELPEMVLYKDTGFNPDQGTWVINMSYSYVGDNWNDAVSSFVVVRGNWNLCRDPNFHDCRKVGPGVYDLRDWAGWDNTISSIQFVSD